MKGIDFINDLPLSAEQDIVSWIITELEEPEDGKGLPEMIKLLLLGATAEDVVAIMEAAVNRVGENPEFRDQMNHYKPWDWQVKQEAQARAAGRD